MSVDDYREWVRYAEQDWQRAVSLLRRKRPPIVAAVEIASVRAFARRWLGIQK
ncbi:MAG: hypothetical protein ACK4WK_10200 [Anaerolineae bacterium]